MKLDPDCMRDVMLLAESAPYDRKLPLGDILDSLPKYSDDTVKYTVIKLEEAGFLDVFITNFEGKKDIISIDDVTYQGHQFLADIRDDGIWRAIKAVGEKLGATSVHGFTQIASGVITALVKDYFGLA